MVRMRGFGCNSYHSPSRAVFIQKVSGTRETYTVRRSGRSLRNPWRAHHHGQTRPIEDPFLDMAPPLLSWAADRCADRPTFEELDVGAIRSPWRASRCPKSFTQADGGGGEIGITWRVP